MCNSLTKRLFNKEIAVLERYHNVFPVLNKGNHALIMLLVTQNLPVSNKEYKLLKVRRADCDIAAEAC